LVDNAPSFTQCDGGKKGPEARLISPFWNDKASTAKSPDGEYKLCWLNLAYTGKQSAGLLKGMKHLLRKVWPRSQESMWLYKQLWSCCWRNIVSTLLLHGIHSLDILLAHCIAVNISYITIGSYRPGHTGPHCIISGYLEKVMKAHFLFLLLVGSVLINEFSFDGTTIDLIIQFSLTAIWTS
jgi:hypothetical protein